MSDKVRENRLRRKADRLGLRLLKSRAQLWRHDNQGGYMIISIDQRIPIEGWNYDLDIDYVEQFLDDYEREMMSGQGGADHE